MGYQQRSPESESRPANQGIIQCHCGACSLTVVDDRAKCFFMCGCSDVGSLPNTRMPKAA